MGYFNKQPMKTVLKSSSSSSSSFYIYNSRKYIIRISKAEPNLVRYGNCNNIQFFVFKTDLNSALRCCLQIINDFDHIFTSGLNHHAPQKIKVIRGNHKLYMNKEIKVIMLRSKFKKIRLTK